MDWTEPNRTEQNQSEPIQSEPALVLGDKAH